MASKVMVKGVLNNPKIEVLWKHQAEGFPWRKWEGVKLVKNLGEPGEERW